MINVRIDEDFADKITRANLVDMLSVLESEITSIEDRLENEGDKLPDYKKIDLHDSRLHKKHIEHVLRYMSVQSDLTEFGLEHLFKE